MPHSWEFSPHKPAAPSPVLGVGAGPGACAADFSRFFPQSGPLWSDAMVARTRCHIAGCTSGVETSLRVALTPNLPEAVLDSLPLGFVWQAMERMPGLLTDSLFAHFRTRAALSLMAGVARSGEPPFEAGLCDVEEDYLGLSIALARWSEARAEDQPMRVDLPAEHMQELLWAVCAQFAQMLTPMEVLPQADLLLTLDTVGQELLGVYDEETGPIARAALIARRLGPIAFREHAIQLAQNGQFLLLCAGIADACRLETSRVAYALVHGDPQKMPLYLFRAADFGPEACALALFALRACRDSLGDERIGLLPEAYAALTREDARGRLMELALSPSFTAALQRLASGGGA